MMTSLSSECALPGEDCSLELKLLVDLIPRRSWFQNVRAVIDRRDWDLLRYTVFSRAGYACELCGVTDTSLECHERFTYTIGESKTHGVQRIVRLLAVCKACHLTTHFGLSTILGIERESAAHLMRVRNWSESEAQNHIADAVLEWELRNDVSWTVDLSMIVAAGYRLTASAKS